VVSPNGETVFVTSARGTVAYSAATGAQLWQTTLAYGLAMTISPSGLTLYMTNDGYTDALSAATGAILWQVANSTPALRGSLSIAVSPAGSMVFVGGMTMVGEAADVVAFNAQTGAELWQAQNSGGTQFNQISVTPDGSTVVAAGYDFTAGYNAATGAQLWTQTIPPGSAAVGSTTLAMSPSGSTAFVSQVAYVYNKTGEIINAYYLTTAYNTATGATVWQKQYDTGPGYGPSAIEVSPDGSTVFIAGTGRVAKNFTYDTVACNAAIGAKLWSATFEADARNVAESLAVSPNSDEVFVTGESVKTLLQYEFFKMVTVAYKY
jgi:outer membrane protein assembly factor BamB